MALNSIVKKKIYDLFRSASEFDPQIIISDDTGVIGEKKYMRHNGYEHGKFSSYFLKEEMKIFCSSTTATEFVNIVLFSIILSSIRVSPPVKKVFLLCNCHFDSPKWTVRSRSMSEKEIKKSLMFKLWQKNKIKFGINVQNAGSLPKAKYDSDIARKAVKEYGQILKGKKRLLDDDKDENIINGYLVDIDRQWGSKKKETKKFTKKLSKILKARVQHNEI